MNLFLNIVSHSLAAAKEKEKQNKSQILGPSPLCSSPFNSIDSTEPRNGLSVQSTNANLCQSMQDGLIQAIQESDFSCRASISLHDHPVHGENHVSIHS